MRNSYKEYYDTIKSNGLFCTKATGKHWYVNIQGWCHPLAPIMGTSIKRYDNIHYSTTLVQDAQKDCEQYKEWINKNQETDILKNSLINHTRDERTMNYPKLLSRRTEI